jgi:sodium-dependent dicarboxylate transporter 2/3/5
LGKLHFEEKVVLYAFIALAILWITRSGFDFGSVKIPGWSSIFEQPKYINDGTVAIAISLLLFIIPSTRERGDRILALDVLNKLPWGIIILFGGGFALAGGFVDSGLSLWMGEKLKAIGHLPPVALIFIIALFMSFLTEITSNTATTQILLPVLAGLAISINVNPLLLMLPATVAASLAFMLPVATPPNAIVFGTGKLKISNMMRTGFWLNMIGVIITSLFSWFWAQYVFEM